ncbi:hypothetical protein K439DRAFT_600504 [Ramaria rubella]|nr:hypothetical protein K439DRAFT_600504 [Ramaria rubella]
MQYVDPAVNGFVEESRCTSCRVYKAVWLCLVSPYYQHHRHWHHWHHHSPTSLPSAPSHLACILPTLHAPHASTQIHLYNSRIMAYSSFFITGLTLASIPRDLPFLSTLPPPSPPASSGLRKHRPSFIPTTPISTTKSLMRGAGDMAKSQVHARIPREGSSVPSARRDRARPRQKTSSDTKELPALPAPTEPLPPLPPHMFTRSLPSKYSAPSIPPTHSSSRPHPFTILNPIPPHLRGPFAPSPYANNTRIPFSA